MGVRVELQDARAVSYCSRGMRDLATQLGLSWETFIKEGYDSDELRQYNHAMINKVIEQAEMRHAREG